MVLWLKHTHLYLYLAGGIAQVGFTESLAKEGKKYNILANLVAPICKILDTSLGANSSS